MVLEENLLAAAYFNSTLVQLKVTDLLFDENDKVGFNSTLVQLKVEYLMNAYLI